jgi:hypothetical protein
LVTFSDNGLRHGLWALGLFLTFIPDALAQQPAPEPAAPRTVAAAPLEPGETVIIDGKLDEPVWQRAVPAGEFVQVEPNNGTQPTERTEVRLAFDGNAFYMGVTCYDSDPNGWLGYQRRRDEFLGADDRFMWTIDTFLDARSGYFFETNPSGLVADSLMGVNGDNRAWDGIWNIKVRRSEIGWTIEVEIPFRTLNFDPNSDTWGINFQRTVRRKNEEMIWMGWPRNQGLRRMTNAGRVTGLRGITQGKGLDIKPYGVLIADASPGRGRQGLRGDPSAGVDVFYNPTPGIRANLTVNTDFAQTEVDQRQVNLTRYSLFFPEKRDFFLDGAIFFDFGSPRGNEFSFFGGRRGGGALLVDPFFSRRIGLSEQGQPQQINYGTKLTGQAGSQDIGLLHVRTGEDKGLKGEDFTVARIKRRMLRQSYIGAIYTRRDADIPGDEARHTAGLDFRLATSQFRGSQNLELSGWLLYATRPGLRSGNSAFGVTLEYPNDRWNASVDAREVQENFDPAVGFVTRRNYRRYTPGLFFGPRPRNSRLIRQYLFGGNLDVQTTLGNDLLVRSLDLTAFQVNFQSQDFFGIWISTQDERLDQPFAISRGITLPQGAEYTFNRFRVGGQTANRRKLAVGGRFETGGFYSGARTERGLNLTLRVRPGVIVYLNGEWNQIRLPQGRFSTRLYRFSPETQFTPWTALVNSVQYDSVSGVVGWQSRFRWILKPGTDLYVVYNHNWLDDPVLDRFATLDRRFASKVLYTHRF